MASTDEREVLSCGGREVAISNPHKVLFPEAGDTKLDLVRYYLAVADGALRAAGGRPNVLVRYPNGIDGEFFYQKRAPESRPDVDRGRRRCSFPSGRTAEEVVPRDAAALAWMANLACLELHPHPVRADDLDHPDELRVDLDPVPGVEWPQIREVARVVHATLDDFGLVGWPKTSGSRGMHVYVRIEPPLDVRSRCAAPRWRWRARSSGGRPALATSKWWKEERHGVFLDYNQNAKDRTVAAAYSVRPTPDARVSAPLDVGRGRRLRSRATSRWRRCRRGSPRSAIATPASTIAPCSLDALLELSARQEREGLGDAPWPPHYRKQPGEPPRVQPSRAQAGRRRTSRRTPTASADRDRPRAREGRRAGRPRALEGAPPGGRRRTSSRPTCSSTRCAAASTTWTRIRVNLQHVPDRAAAAAGSARSRRGSADGLGERSWLPTGRRRRPSRARTAS